MIASIEQQRIGRRRIAKDNRQRSNILEFTYPGMHKKQAQKRTSWRTIQQIRRPKRATTPSVRVVREKPAERSRKSAPGVGGSVRSISRGDLVLITIMVLCLLLPLGARLPLLAPTEAEIELPGSRDIESALIQYLSPNEHEGADLSVPEQQILDSISTSSYTVRSGDTISGIAQRFGLSMDTVISFNGIQDARNLSVGTVLTVPDSDGLKYRVRRGDYLGGIAKKNGIALNELLDSNGLETSVIVPGQELFIPGAHLSEMERNRVFGRLFIYPTRGRITDRFGMRRDPFTGMRRFHNGIDLAAPVGTPVTAAMSGKVAMVGFNPTYGKYIIMTHPEGFQTLYGHLSVFRIDKGQSVKQGQRIADMGNSGYSTGSHLHFSIFRRGEPIDPFEYLH